MADNIIKGIDTSILDMLEDQVIVVESKTRSIVFANKAFIDKFGKDKSIIGLKCWKFYGEKSHTKCSFKNLYSGKKKRNLIIQKENGEGSEYYEVSVSLIKDGEGNEYYLHVSKDVTNNKLNELEMKKSEIRYKQIFDNLYNVFFEVDFEGKIIDLTPSIERITKYRRDEILGKNVLMFYKNKKQREEYIRNIREKGAIEDFEVEFVDKDGLTLYCSLTAKLVFKDGSPHKIIGILRDISEEKKTRFRLNKTNNMLISLFETSSQLQDTMSIEEISDIALESFSGIGYDRVRLYVLRDGKFHGVKSNHMEKEQFEKISFGVEDKKSKVYKVYHSKKPIVIKDPITKIGTVLDKVGLRESATLPLLSEDKIIGLISIDNKFSKVKIFEDDLNLLMTFANQIAAAIENALLHQKNLNQLKIWSSLYDISSAISTTLDLEKILNLMVIKIIKLLKADMCKLLLLDESEKNLIPYAVCDIYSDSPKLLGSLKVKDSISGITIKKNKPVYISHDKTTKFHDKVRRDLFKGELKTMLSVPLQIENVPIGVINIYTRKPRIYRDDEMELLISIANQAAVIIENSRLYERVRSDKDKLSVLLEISTVINSTFDLDILLKKILDMTVKFTNSDSGYISLFESDELRIKYSKGYVRKIEGLICGKNSIAYKVYKSVKLRVVHSFETGNTKRLGLNKNTKSFVALPLMKKNEPIGVLVLESRRKEVYKWFNKSLTILTNHISVAIENSFFYDRISAFNDELKDEIAKATEELRAKNKELLEIDSMKDDFVSNVSHELRTPLTSIMGYSKLLRMEKIGKLNPDQMQSLKIIEEESDRLTRLINNVLDISKLESGKLKPTMEEIDISDIIRAALNTVKGFATDKNIKLKFETKLKKTFMFGSSDMLKQVLLNLLNNAIKFSFEGGKVEVRLSKENKKMFRIEIIDEGKGIPEKDLKKLFDKFFQVDSSLSRSHGGTGLGLVIVKHIIDLHGGKINVESKEGAGSNFSFTLPVPTGS